MHAIQRTGRFGVGRRGAHHLAASHTDQPLLAHQPLHSAARRGVIWLSMQNGALESPLKSMTYKTQRRIYQQYQ
jgi:hypothetical protein